MAASSLTQKQLSSDRTGTYEVTGEIITTDKIEGELPQGTVFLAYDLKKTGTIETASLGELGEQHSTEISRVLERQANPNLDASAETSTEDAEETSGSTGDQTSEEAETQSTNSDREGEDTEDSESDTDQNTDSDRGSGAIEIISDLLERISELF
jgi:hypothetical protein